MNGAFMADVARRKIPRGGRPRVGVPAGYGAGRGQLAADAVAGGAAGDAAVAYCPAEPGAEAPEKLAQTLRSRSPDATDALPTQGVPAEVRPCSTL